MGHILRKEDSFLARKMLMRMQKPYEEGSILLDAPQHDTMNELAELAKDKEEWQGAANAICPAKRLNTAVLGRSDPRDRPKKTAGAAKCAPPPCGPPATAL